MTFKNFLEKKDESLESRKIHTLRKVKLTNRGRSVVERWISHGKMTRLKWNVQ